MQQKNQQCTVSSISLVYVAEVHSDKDEVYLMANAQVTPKYG